MLLARRSSCFCNNIFKFSPRNVYTGKENQKQGKIIDAEYQSGDETEERSLSLVERAKSLVQLRISGTLSSLAIKMKNKGENKADPGDDDDAPGDSPPLWASIMPYAIYESNPVFGVFPKERHSSNLYLHEQASLVVCFLFPY